MKLLTRFVTFFVIGMCGCSKSDPVTPIIVSESKFLITNTNAGGTGIISMYKKPGGISTDAAYTLSATSGGAIPETIADFQIYGGKVYMVRAARAVIEVANLDDLSQAQSIQYAKPLATNFYKHVGVTNNKIFVGDRDFNSSSTSQNTAFLKVVTLGQSKIDSIGIVKNSPITAIAVSTKYVYVAGGNNPQTLFVIDATSYAKVASITIPGFCTEIIIDQSNNILAFYNGHMTKFSGTDYSIIKDKLIGGANVNVVNDDVASNTAYVLDKENNLLYFLANAPQPASAPYLLKSYDLNTDIVDFVSTQFISAETIAFDNVDKQIIVGSYDTKGVVKFLTPKGELKAQFNIPGPPGAVQIDQ